MCQICICHMCQCCIYPNMCPNCTYPNMCQNCMYLKICQMFVYHICPKKTIEIKKKYEKKYEICVTLVCIIFVNIVSIQTYFKIELIQICVKFVSVICVNVVFIQICVQIVRMQTCVKIACISKFVKY